MQATSTGAPQLDGISSNGWLRRVEGWASLDQVEDQILLGDRTSSRRPKGAQCLSLLLNVCGRRSNRRCLKLSDVDDIIRRLRRLRH